jgi:hypothetical protein
MVDIFENTCIRKKFLFLIKAVKIKSSNRLDVAPELLVLTYVQILRIGRHRNNSKFLIGVLPSSKWWLVGF